MTDYKLYQGDNLDILRQKKADTIDLVYLDPPFNSGRDYTGSSGGFTDTWKWDEEAIRAYNCLSKDLQALVRVVGNINGEAMQSYLVFMAIRLTELRRVMKPTASIYLHIDPTASHYLKLVMDTIFGCNNYINEIIWHYGKWTNTASHFQKNHDTLYSYAKNFKSHTFNKLHQESTNQSKHYQRGYHTNKVNGVTQLLVYDWDKAQHKIDEGKYDKIVDRVGKTSVVFPDVWNIPILNSQSKERTGYPTQKPLALLERIVLASSNPGDLVLDPFCGSGTMIEACIKHKRGVIGIDINDNSTIIHNRIQ